MPPGAQRPARTPGYALQPGVICASARDRPLLPLPPPPHRCQPPLNRRPPPARTAACTCSRRTPPSHSPAGPPTHRYCRTASGWDSSSNDGDGGGGPPRPRPTRRMFQRRPVSPAGVMGHAVYTPKEHGSKARRGGSRTAALAATLLLLAALLVLYPRLAGRGGGSSRGGRRAGAAGARGEADLGRVLVSYSYFEKDPIQARWVAGCCRPLPRRRWGAAPVGAAAPCTHHCSTSLCTPLNLRRPCWRRHSALQRDNFDFFMTIGMGLGNRVWPGPAATDFVVVLNGEVRAGPQASPGWAGCWGLLSWGLLLRSQAPPPLAAAKRKLPASAACDCVARTHPRRLRAGMHPLQAPTPADEGGAATQPAQPSGRAPRWHGCMRGVAAA